MNWQEKLTQLSMRQPGMLATATTGLKPEEGDEVIAVALCAMQPDGTWGRALLVRSDIRDDELNKSREYHKFDRMQLNALGKTDMSFSDELKQRLEGRTWFSYNVPFQLSFLSTWVDSLDLYDLPQIIKLADSGRPLPELYDMHDLSRRADLSVGRPPGFMKMCQARGINGSSPAGVFPVRHSVQCLYALWQRLQEQEFRE